MQTTLKPIESFYTQSLGSRLCGVPSDHIDDCWPEVRPWIEIGLGYSDNKYSTHSIYRSLKNKDMQLWVSVNDDVEAVCVTQIDCHPNKKTCLIFLVAGRNMDNWLHFSNVIETWAKSQGCQSIECYGRPGWEKITGWEKIHVVLRKHLT